MYLFLFFFSLCVGYFFSLLFYASLYAIYLDLARVQKIATHASSRNCKILDLLGTQLREYGTPVRKGVLERPNASCSSTLAEEDEPPRLRYTVVNSVQRLSPGSKPEEDRRLRISRKEEKKLL